MTMKKTTTNKKSTASKKTASPKKTASAPSKTVKQVTKRNAIMVALETSFPTNTQRVDRNLSHDLKDKGMSSHKGLQYIMVKREIGKNNKEVLVPWACFQKAVNVKNKINQLVDQRSLDLTVKGNRLFPVSQFDLFKTELAELNRQLKECAEELTTNMSAIKAEDLDRLRNSHDKDGNPVDLSCFYDDTLYPTEDKIANYGVRYIPAPLTSDYFGEAEAIFEDAEKQKVNRLLSKVSDMFVAINNYIKADAKKFTENSIENVVAEAQLLKEFDFGSENDAFNKLCDRAVEIATSVNAPAIREAWAKVNKDDGKVTEDVRKDAVAYLDKTSDELSNALDELKKGCEGLF